MIQIRFFKSMKEIWSETFLLSRRLNIISQRQRRASESLESACDIIVYELAELLRLPRNSLRMGLIFFFSDTLSKNMIKYI